VSVVSLQLLKVSLVFTMGVCWMCTKLSNKSLVCVILG